MASLEFVRISNDGMQIIVRDEHGRPVRVLFSREDVVRLGAKRPPIAAGVRRDGTGVVHVVRTPTYLERVAEVVVRVDGDEPRAQRPEQRDHAYVARHDEDVPAEDQGLHLERPGRQQVTAPQAAEVTLLPATIAAGVHLSGASVEPATAVAAEVRGD
mgnify:CR=1 FL=1